MAGNFITDGAALTSVKAEEAGAEESAILAKMVDVPSGCEEAAMVAKEVAREETGGNQALCAQKRIGGLQKL